MCGLSLQQAPTRLRGKKKGFTLVELLVVMSIIIILASIGMYAYQRGLAYAKETVCKTNLKVLEDAVERYLMENDAFPASLGQLKPEHLEKAYAKAMEDRGWLKKLCFFLVKYDASEQAYAQFLTYENLKRYGLSERILHCPADINGGVSYGINSNIAGKKWSDVDKDEIIVADCDYYTFATLDELAKRHNHKALALRRNREIVEVLSNDKVDVSEKPTDTGTPPDETDTVTICHKPGTPSEQTMTIPKSALAGHLGHGDSVGRCE